MSQEPAQDLLNRYACVTLTIAAAIIGGDKPIGRTALLGLIAAGKLQDCGSGKLRRVTTESIRRYLAGERQQQPAPSRTKYVPVVPVVIRERQPRKRPPTQPDTPIVFTHRTPKKRKPAEQ
jgi:hypothetical protein